LIDANDYKSRTLTGVVTIIEQKQWQETVCDHQFQ